MRPLDELAERTLEDASAGRAASESELWNAVRFAWKRRRLRHWRLMCDPNVLGANAEFDPGRAANVIAADLTRRGVALREDGALEPEDLAAYLGGTASPPRPPPG